MKLLKMEQHGRNGGYILEEYNSDTGVNMCWKYDEHDNPNVDFFRMKKKALSQPSDKTR